MKKILLIFLSAVISISVCSCDGNKDIDTANAESQVQATEYKTDQISEKTPQELKSIFSEYRRFKGGTFPYLDALIRGETEELKERINISEFKEMATEDAEKAWQFVHDIYEYPDYIDESGHISVAQYWLDDSGYESIEFVYIGVSSQTFAESNMRDSILYKTEVYHTKYSESQEFIFAELLFTI